MSLTEDELTAIKARAQAATPAPWQWRGNVEHDDPRLEGGPRRMHVLGLMRRERTAEDRSSRDFATWLGESEKWDGNLKGGEGGWRSHTDEEIAETLKEDWLEEPNGEPRYDDRLAFVDPDKHLRMYARDLAIFEVCPDATSVDDERVYRGDIVGLRNPDAAFIAHARADVDSLLAELDRVNGELTRLTADYEGLKARAEHAEAERGKLEDALGLANRTSVRLRAERDEARAELAKVAALADGVIRFLPKAEPSTSEALTSHPTPSNSQDWEQGVEWAAASAAEGVKAVREVLEAARLLRLDYGDATARCRFSAAVDALDALKSTPGAAPNLAFASRSLADDQIGVCPPEEMRRKYRALLETWERQQPVIEEAKALVGRMRQAVGWSILSASQWLDPLSYALYRAVDGLESAAGEGLTEPIHHGPLFVDLDWASNTETGTYQLIGNGGTVIAEFPEEQFDAFAQMTNEMWDGVSHPEHFEDETVKERALRALACFTPDEQATLRQGVPVLFRLASDKLVADLKPFLDLLDESTADGPEQAETGEACPNCAGLGGAHNRDCQPSRCNNHNHVDERCAHALGHGGLCEFACPCPDHATAAAPAGEVKA